MNHPQINKASPAPDPFNEFDRHFGRFIARFGGDGENGENGENGEKLVMERIAASLSRSVRQGHLCLDLSCGVEGFDEAEVRKAIAASRAIAEPGSQLRTPLVLDEAGRLYLRRFYEDERGLAEALRERAGKALRHPGGLNGQEEAVKAALDGRLTVISGGPGTGKTTTAVRILQNVLSLCPETRIALAAPTGKAAARLEEAIRDGLGRLDGPGGLELRAAMERLPRARTLEGLLGIRPGSAAIRHHAGNPLPVDLLVVDEASMIALPLMAKLFAALPPGARIVLLGDRDQLASVAPGSVLADLADGLPGVLVMLKKNHRFGNESGIYQLCEAIRAGEGALALEIIERATREAWADLGSAPLPVAGGLARALKPVAIEHYGPVISARDPAAALEAFSRFRVLCALRRGPYGVEGLNRQIEALLREAGLIHGRGPFYAGLPILITRNDYSLNLMNGSVGILLPDPDEGNPGHSEETERADGSGKPLWAWFPGEGNSLRRIAPSRLPEHEPAYAMTVHKSQGSEFERVLMLLPDRETPVLTRELIYTGVTRARRRVDVWYDRALFEGGVARKTERASGLRDALAR